MENIYNLTKEDLESYLININDKKFRSTQIYDWLYVKRVKSFDEMTNLSKTLISKLKKDFKCNHLEIVKEEKDKDVSKYLFKLYDGNYVETVLMEHNYGLSLCVSSEVGCNMGCIFCESGRLKKVRNLYAYEIVLQILMIEERIKREFGIDIIATSPSVIYKVELTNVTTSDNYKIDEGKLNAGKEKTFYLNLWIDYNTTTSGWNFFLQVLLLNIPLELH